MKFDELNENNYLLFAIKFYDNPQALTRDDFEANQIHKKIIEKI